MYSPTSLPPLSHLPPRSGSLNRPLTRTEPLKISFGEETKSLRGPKRQSKKETARERDVEHRRKRRARERRDWQGGEKKGRVIRLAARYYVRVRVARVAERPVPLSPLKRVVSPPSKRRRRLLRSRARRRWPARVIVGSQFVEHERQPLRFPPGGIRFGRDRLDPKEAKRR